MSERSKINSPSLAIVIVNWNSYDVTKNCLESLRGLEYPVYGVIVTDNGSDDGSGERLKQDFAEITLLVNSENMGFTGGNNTGIAYALEQGFDLVMLLNNDTITPPDFASVLVASLMADKALGAIQPKILYNQERDVIWNAGSFYNEFWAISKPRGFDETDMGQYDTALDIPWVTGCCFLTHSHILRQIGLLDQRFFIYYEDTDWSFKIRKLGYRLRYEPKAHIYHEVGMSNQNRKGHNEGNVSPFTHYQSVRNHLYIIRRYAKGVNKIGAWSHQLAKFIGYVGYFILRGRFTKLRYVIRGFKDGLVK